MAGDSTSANDGQVAGGAFISIIFERFMFSSMVSNPVSYTFMSPQ